MVSGRLPAKRRRLIDGYTPIPGKQTRGQVRSRSCGATSSNVLYIGGETPSVLEVFQHSGTRRAGLNATGIGFADESNNIRAGMNADGIAYFDESGNVVWCAPGC